MLRDKLTKELGHKSYREVMKKKECPYRMIMALCKVLDLELEGIETRLEALKKKQESIGSTVFKLDNAKDSA